MTNKEDKIIVLTRRAIPLMELLGKDGTLFCFEVFNDFVSFNIYGDDDLHICWNCSYTAVDDSDVGEIHFRTFDSMKEILWTIREALS